MSHSGPEGDFREGARLRGDHPAVSANPLYFIEDGATDLEKTVEMQRRFPDFHPMTR